MDAEEKHMKMGMLKAADKMIELGCSLMAIIAIGPDGESGRPMNVVFLGKDISPELFIEHATVSIDETRAAFNMQQEAPKVYHSSKPSEN